MIKITDYIAESLIKLGVKNIYAITGGAVMHILDSLTKKKLNIVFCHHEQAALLAATTEARINNKVGCAVVTQGPGVTNSMTGLAAAWFDSMPCLVLSGQARTDLFSKRHKKVRQLAPQSFNINNLVGSLSNKIFTPESITDFSKNYHKALFSLTSPRPGPVWIDIPVNIQWSKIDLTKIEIPKLNNKKKNVKKNKVIKFINLIKQSKKPLLLIGSGIKLSNQEKEFLNFYKLNNIPLISTWNASDIVDNNSKFFIGRPGIFGQRGANYIIQKSDLILCLGTGLGPGLTTYNFNDFGRNAKKIIVNIDSDELNTPRFKVDLKWHIDLKNFFSFVKNRKFFNLSSDWIEEAKKIKKMNMLNFKRKIKTNDVANPYLLCDQISKLTKNKKTIFCIDGGGIITQVAPQMLSLSKYHKINISAGLCTMGCLPEALGAKIARRDHDVVFLTGDGSMMMNLQELQTIDHYKKNIKIFILSNKVYGLMKIAQKSFFERRYVGSTKKSGISFPNFKKVSEIFNFSYFSLNSNKDIITKLPKILAHKNKLICEVNMSNDFKMNPVFSTRVSGGKKVQASLDEMEPYLSQKEKV